MEYNGLIRKQEPLIKESSSKQTFFNWRKLFNRKKSNREPQSAEQKLLEAIKDRNKKEIKKLLINFNNLKKLKKIINNSIGNIKTIGDFLIIETLFERKKELIDKNTQKEKKREHLSELQEFLLPKEINLANKIIKTQNYNKIKLYILYILNKENLKLKGKFNFNFVNNRTPYYITSNMTAIKEITDINIYFLLYKYNILQKSDIRILALKKGIGPIILISAYKNLEKIKQELGVRSFDKANKILREYETKFKMPLDFKIFQSRIYETTKQLYQKNQFDLIEKSIEEEFVKENFHTQKKWKEYLEEKQKAKKEAYSNLSL